MVKRLVTVLLFLLVGLSAVALIPEAPPIRQAAVKMELPGRIAGWGGTSRQASQQEKDILADDTEFEKRDYAEFPPRTTVEQLKQVAATIVLSGHDLNNSIHDPVRCARAQGFKGIEVASKTLDLGDGESLEVKRMLNYLEFPREGGEPIRVPFVTYFWFVGTDHVTESHYSRALIDIRGRLLGGYDQRWAYFNISTGVTEGLDDLWARDEEATDKVLEKFCKKIYQECVVHEAIGGN